MYDFPFSDHCAKKLLPWFDGMLEANEEYFKANGEPLFSSHMLDLSAVKSSMKRTLPPVSNILSGWQQ